jgi:hypothetical protein
MCPPIPLTITAGPFQCTLPVSTSSRSPSVTVITLEGVQEMQKNTRRNRWDLAESSDLLRAFPVLDHYPRTADRCL